MRTIQIPYDLFLDLVRYHLTGLRDEDIETHIKLGLQDKLDRAAARERYGEEVAMRKHSLTTTKERPR